jgi:hypothetical protein
MDYHPAKPTLELALILFIYDQKKLLSATNWIKAGSHSSDNPGLKSVFLGNRLILFKIKQSLTVRNDLSSQFVLSQRYVPRSSLCQSVSYQIDIRCFSLLAALVTTVRHLMS